MNNEKISLKINGHGVRAIPGQTILEAACENGIDISTLCFYPKKMNVDICQFCLVEVNDDRSLVMPCSTSVTPGMEIKTDTKAIRDAQQVIPRLVWASGAI